MAMKAPFPTLAPAVKTKSEQLEAAVRKTLADMQKTEVHVTEVVRHGEQITVPANMEISDVIDVLRRRQDYEEKVVNINREFSFSHLDGAVALVKAIEEKYGWAEATGIEGWFGTTPPQLIQVATAPGKTVTVPWGRFNIPNVTGHLESSLGHKNKQHVFQLNASVARKHEAEVKALGDRIEEIVREGSIYRGKALKIKMDATSLHECGAMPDPEFLELSNVHPEELIFSEDVRTQIETNVFTLIDQYEDCMAAGVPFKHGVLLAGAYGTGKTLAAMVAAYKATQAGITFIYCQSADHFAGTIEFARQYGRAVVFCEDIDKVMEGERDIDMDEILNVIDGIEAKNSEIMIVLTTNDIQRIHPAMLRPGRLDAVIHVKPPDALAVTKLIRLYGRGLIPADEDLTSVGVKLAGQIPAVVREAVERAKLSAIRLHSQDKHGKVVLSGEALLDAANGMAMQLELLQQERPATLSELEKAAMILKYGHSSKEPKPAGTNGDASHLPGLPPGTNLITLSTLNPEYNAG